MIFIHTTCRDLEEARKLGDMIIQNKLAACVDFWPISSCCNLNGRLVCQDRVKLLISTFESRLDSITRLINENHSEMVPLIAGVDVRRLNHSYKEWMMEVLR